MDVELVERAGRDRLLDGGAAAVDLDGLLAGGLAGQFQGLVEAFGHEVEGRAALHLQRFARVVREDIDVVVEGRVVAPPAAAVFVLLPGAGAAAVHLAAHDPGARAGDRLTHDVAVDAGLPALVIVSLAPRHRREGPLVQLLAADAERVLHARVRAGHEAVEGHREVCEYCAHGPVDHHARENSSVDLVGERERLLEFARGSRHPDGGFGWLRTDGSLDLSRGRELWINTRMTHVFALAGEMELTAWGLEALRTSFRDSVHGGWFSRAG